MREFSYEDIEAATKSFASEQLIGKGSHGSVYRGRLTDGRIVAVKKPSRLLNDDKLSNEIDMLASVKNSGVVDLVGVSRGPTGGPLLVMEFMHRGSLHDLLHSSSNPPAWPRRFAMALQLARAVLFLHEAAPAIIHRDIKSANVLLDNRWNAKLADFSIAVRRDDRMQPLDSPIPAGTIGYLDPCYDESGELGPRNDVFSFGVVLLELVSCRKAMDMERDPSSIVSWALPILRANRLAELCDGKVALPGRMKRPIRRMLSIAEKCVSEKVEGRPLMGEVVRELQGVVEDVMPWPILGSVRSKVSEGVHKSVRAWRRWVEKRVNTGKSVACKDYLLDDGGADECGDDAHGKRLLMFSAEK
nr:PREDICTED: serine/threonine-protein kinase-like protein At5g23170 isoform X2 [Musa acuminata subsp. malaccensis]